LRTVETVAAAGVPTLVMTYWNPVDHYGVSAFARDLAAAGGAGLITPDLPPEEAGDWLEAAEACGLDRVFLVAPSSSDARITRITEDCRGFVYAASLMGTTGARDSVGAAPRFWSAGSARPPACPSLSASESATGAQAAEVAGFADGVIVGSAFVQRLLAAPDARAGWTPSATWPPSSPPGSGPGPPARPASPVR